MHLNQFWMKLEPVIQDYRYHLSKFHIYALAYCIDVFLSGLLHPKAALVVRNLPANAGDARDVGLVPSLGRSPRVGTGNPLQYSHLENPMDRRTGGQHSMGLQRVRHD